MYMFCRIMSAKKFRNLNFKACGFQENMISYRQRVNMDPGRQGRPLARRTPKECVSARLFGYAVLHTFIQNPTPSAAKLAALVRPACSLFRSLSPRSRMVRHVQENIVGEKRRKKSLTFCTACGTILEQSRDRSKSCASGGIGRLARFRF